MIFWRTGLGGFRGAAKRFIKGVFQYRYTATTESAVAPNATFGLFSIIQSRGLGVLCTISSDGLGVSSSIDESEGLLSIIQSRGKGVTSTITEDGKGVNSGL